MEGMGLAVFRRRTPGALRWVEITGGDPPIVVQFEVPDGVRQAQCEAAAAATMSALRKVPAVMARYRLESRALGDDEIMALNRLVYAVEAAILLWRDWNFALVDEDGAEPVKSELTPSAIAGLLLEDPSARTGWLVQLDANSPLERAEGNASGASPAENSGEAPNIAEAADSTIDPAAEVSPAPQGDTVTA